MTRHRDHRPDRVFITCWDECAIAAERVAILKEDDPSLSDDEGFRHALIDQDVFAMEWDWMLEDLGAALRDLGPGDRYRAEGRNTGWRQRAGRKNFRAASAAEFLRAILPSTDCTFVIEREGQALHIANYHHDAPTGAFYTITANPDEEDPS